MQMNTVYVLVQSGFADWEAASALAELRRTFGFPVKAIGLTSEPVVSMGGFKVIPDLALADFVPESAAMLILPGGESWIQGELPAISEAVHAVVGHGRPVAAICAATLALARCGLLDESPHTSNGKGYIEKFVPNYRGHEYYRSEPSVNGKHIITANGLSPFAFAANIFRALAPEREVDIQMYEELYSRGLLD
jgi:putative intracellular protease/amidase